MSSKGEVNKEPEVLKKEGVPQQQIQVPKQTIIQTHEQVKSKDDKQEEVKQEINKDKEMELEDLPKTQKLNKPVDAQQKAANFGSISKNDKESVRKGVTLQPTEPRATPSPVQPQAELPRPPADSQLAPTQEPKPRESAAPGRFGLFDLDSLPDIPKKHSLPRQPEKTEARPAEDVQMAREQRESQAASGTQRKRQKQTVVDEDHAPSVFSPNQMPVKKQMSAKHLPDKYSSMESATKDKPSNKIDR